MFTIAAILTALAIGFIGIRRGFIAAWIMLFNVMFSVYLSVMAVAVTGKYFPDSLPNQWAKGGDLIFTAVFIFVMLHFLSVHLFEDRRMPDLPKYFDTAAAGVCGLIAGYVAFWMVIYSVAITPMNKLDLFKGKPDQPTIVEVGRSKIEALSGVLECLSLQEDDKQSEKLFFWLETHRAKFVKKPKAETAKPKVQETKPTKACTNGQSATANTAIIPSDPNSDPNEPVTAQK